MTDDTILPYIQNDDKKALPGINFMNILMINKFLYQNGGSETYIFKLGQTLVKHGHNVQYFGMEHEGRLVGNEVGAYTKDMDFHAGGLSSVTYAARTIYSREARKKIRLVLDDFKPDVCHLNNFNYQITPSVILEIRKWERESGHRVKIVFTAHDYQLVCPNHMFYNPNTKEICEKCAEGAFFNCVKGKCIHSSTVKSATGYMEAKFWRMMGTYRQIDEVICPTKFMKSKMDLNPAFDKKTTAMLNFVDKVEKKNVKKEDYVLYFGRFSKEKGIATLIKVCRKLKEVKFVFAGTGPMEDELCGMENVTNLGFLEGDELSDVIRKARFSVYPSEWYENCPFSVMESQMYGTPVVGANIGGIPELIDDKKTGELFESGNADELLGVILKLWNDKNLSALYAKNCENLDFDTPDDYYEKLIKIYEK